jgi:hypothetical protein
MQRSITTFLLLCALLSIGQPVVQAQTATTASVTGVVRDNAGSVLQGATIKLRHTPSGTIYGAVSRKDGRYNVTGARIGGPYVLTTTMVGMTSSDIAIPSLALGETRRIDVKLETSAVETKAVTVTAAASNPINAGRTGASETVSEQQITAFPTISRNFQDFLRFSPQTASAGGGTAIGGRNNRYNNIQIDGTQLNDLFGLGSNGAPGGQANTTPISLDAVEEFQVLVSPYDVRQGRFSGGGINAVTRSGTNTWTGSAYGFFRNQGMIGDLNSTVALSKAADGSTLPVGEYRDSTITTPFSEFSEYQTGVRVGGPLIQDKLFMFVNVETTNRTQPKPQLAFSQNANGSIIQSIADSVSQILSSAYGYNAGALDNQEVTRPSNKIFARLDWNLSENHRLTLRHNLVSASDDIYNPSRTNVLLGNRMYTFNSTTNSTVLQLNSVIDNDKSNELIVGYTTVRDARDIAGDRFPTVNVSDSRITGINISAGAENFSLRNQLSTDVLEITDNFTMHMGDHTLTLGTQNEFFSFSNLFIRDNAGTWNFNSLNDLRNGVAARLQYSFARPGFADDWKASFSTAQLGVYAQDEWEVSDNLRITIGLRADMPMFMDQASFNPTADTIRLTADSSRTLGLNTSVLPSTALLWSPRIGFNWNSGGDKPLQIRGGVGIFTGRIPFVWISNQFSNTGVEIARLDLRSSATDTLKFNPDLDPKDPAFYTRVGGTTELNVTTANFKMPQSLRLNIAADRELFDGYVGTVEAIYSKNINEIYYTDLNLGARSDTTAFGTTLPGGRGVYGTYSGRNTTPRTNVGSFARGPFTNIIELGNTDQGYSYSVSAQLRKQFTSGWFASVFYTYGRSFDLNSGLSSQAVSQWRFNHIQDNPNDAMLSASLFDIPHRFVASVSKRFEYGEGFATTVSAFYELRSGRPFSYVYDGDLNADGQTENDLMYVPKDANDASEILMGRVVSVGSGASRRDSLVVASATSRQQLESYISRDEYLSTVRGQIAERFGAREPFVHQLDLRIAQEIANPFAKGQRLEITVDVINALNLVNPEWGRVQSVNNNRDVLLRFEGLTTPSMIKDASTPAGVPIFSYTDKKNPFGYDDLLSRYQIQLGVRYTF